MCVDSDAVADDFLIFVSEFRVEPGSPAILGLLSCIHDECRASNIFHKEQEESCRHPPELRAKPKTSQTLLGCISKKVIKNWGPTSGISTPGGNYLLCGKRGAQSTNSLLLRSLKHLRHLEGRHFGYLAWIDMWTSAWRERRTSMNPA